MIDFIEYIIPNPCSFLSPWRLHAQSTETKRWNLIWGNCFQTVINPAWKYNDVFHNMFKFCSTCSMKIFCVCAVLVIKTLQLSMSICQLFTMITSLVNNDVAWVRISVLIQFLLHIVGNSKKITDTLVWIGCKR